VRSEAKGRQGKGVPEFVRTLATGFFVVEFCLLAAWVFWVST